MKHLNKSSIVKSWKDIVEKFSTLDLGPNFKTHINDLNEMLVVLENAKWVILINALIDSSTKLIAALQREITTHLQPLEPHNTQSSNRSCESSNRLCESNTRFGG